MGQYVAKTTVISLYYRRHTCRILQKSAFCSRLCETNCVP